MTARNAFANLSTEAKQDAIITALTSVVAKLSADPATQTTLAAILAAIDGTLLVDGSAHVQPVSATALPLPAGAATSAAQASAQTSLTSILGKLSADPATQTTLAAVLGALQGTLAVSTASLPLPAGAATQTTLAALLAAVTGTLTVDGSGHTQPVSGTVTANISGTVPVSGTFWQATQPVSIATLPALATGANVIGAVTQSGGPWTVAGAVAAAATDSGNPVKVGGVYNSTLPTYTTGQRVDFQADPKGRMRVEIGSGAGTSTPTIGAPADGTTGQAGLYTASQGSNFNGATWDRQRGDVNGLVAQAGLSSTFWNYASASGGIVNTATAVTIKAAGAAGVRTFLKTLTVGHDALGAATEIAIRDGAAGTVLWRGRLQTAAAEDKVITFDPPLKGTAVTLMEIVTLTAVTGGVFVNASGFTGS